MANANSLAGLTKWLGREEWREAFDELLDRHLGPPCKKADIPVEKLLDLVGEHHCNVLWGCIFEDFLSRDLDDGRNIADDYLKRRGWKESASNKAYIAALRSSVMSLYEVSDIVRDESFRVRDLVRGGEPVRVSERLGTRSLNPWDRIAARIVTIGPKIEMAGGALPFDHQASEIMLKELGRARKKALAGAKRSARRVSVRPVSDLLSDTEFLRSAAFMFSNAWLDDALRKVLHPTFPHLRNADGDEIEFTTVSYPLGPRTSADAIRSTLDSVPSLRPADEGFWNWTGTQDARPAKGDSDGLTIVTTLDDGAPVLGTVELKDNVLAFEANSRQRTERGRALLEPVLGGLVGKPRITVQTLDQLMSSRPAGKPERPSSGLAPDEERAVIHANLDLYYTKLLDQRVPALGNVSPRTAAKTAKGREKVVGWLKFMENSAARSEAGSAMAGYDFGWLWRALGVDKLRR
jgi:hypothetical protein